MIEASRKEEEKKGATSQDTYNQLGCHLFENTQDPDAGKDQGQEENGETEVEMVGWHH